MRENQEEMILEEVQDIEETTVPESYLGDDDPFTDYRFELFLSAKELLNDWNPFYSHVF